MLVVVAAVLLALLGGAAAAVLPPFFLAVFAGVVLLPGLFVLWLQGRLVASRDWLFAFVLIGLLVLPMVGRLSGVRLGTPWQAALLLFCLLGVMPFLRDVARSPWLKVMLVCFVGFLSIAIVSTAFGRSQPMAAAFQFVSDLKPLLLVALGYALCWDRRSERWLDRVLTWAWLPMALMVAFEWVAPGAYWQLTFRMVNEAPADPAMLFPSRAIGIFDHPSMLAAAGAGFGLLCFARWMTDPSGRVKHAALTVVYCVLVLCSVQRQELASLMLALLCVFAIRNPKSVGRNAFVMIFLAAAAACAVVLAFPQFLHDEMSKWGIGTVGAIDRPRAQIFAGGWYLAMHHFPLGAGLGTFAGAGAEKFDLSVYTSLGFGRYWWFGRKDYLLDTYWPNSLGEAGFFGAGLLLAAYLALAAHAFRLARSRHGKPGHAYALAAAGGMVYMLSVSLTSPAFQDPRLFVFPAILFGVVARIASQDARRDA